MSTPADGATFPRLYARTLRFSMGVPRSFAISPDGTRLTFLRSPSGDDRRNELWAFDTTTGLAKRVVESRGSEELSIQERARRERLRESSGGITSYTTDGDHRLAVYTESGEIRVADLVSGKVKSISHPVAAIDPRPSPDGSRIGYAAVDGSFRIAHISEGKETFTHADSGKSFGQAEFVASEEMNRYRGFWWSPDSQLILVQSTDESEVLTWHISDPAHPEQTPRAIKYPKVGTANAVVSLVLMTCDGDISRQIALPAGFEYLVEVNWNQYGPPLLYCMDRSQHTAAVFALDIHTGDLTELATQRDDHWVEITPGVPTWLPSGELLLAHDESETRVLTINGRQVTPDGLQVTGVVDVDRFGITFTGTFEPTESHLWWYGFGGELDQLSPVGGMHTGRARNHTLVISSRSLDEYGVKTEIHRDGKKWEITSHAWTPSHDATPEFIRLGKEELRAALLLPESGGRTNLPLLVDPYGGPHALRVVAAKNAYAEAQWFANQGFAVLIADGRGTPHRGPEWEKAISGDLATIPLQDQVAAVEALIALRPGLIDPARVAIRGWSFGGYLAALAVMDAPHTFAAAIAGAPVGDFRLYDTFYTERYLGITGEEAGYEISSLYPRAHKLSRPLMIIHGLADDNVVVAHSLQLSSHLLAAGRPHETLMLSNVTHMTPQEEVAENLLLLQVEFLRRHLQVPAK